MISEMTSDGADRAGEPAPEHNARNHAGADENERGNERGADREDGHRGQKGRPSRPAGLPAPCRNPRHHDREDGADAVRIDEGDHERARERSEVHAA